MSAIDEPAHSPLGAAFSDGRIAPLVRDARRCLVRALQTGLAQHGVAAGHWTFLRILWQRDDINQRKLSELAGVMEPTTFAALQAMERLGYITRRRRPDNRKNIYVYLTREGRALKEKLMPIAIAINARAIADVSKADLAATRRTLLAVIENLVDAEAEPAGAVAPALNVQRPPAPNQAAAVPIAREPGRRAQKSGRHPLS